jgi:hypothetical protein
MNILPCSIGTASIDRFIATLAYPDTAAFTLLFSRYGCRLITFCTNDLNVGGSNRAFFFHNASLPHLLVRPCVTLDHIQFLYEKPVRSRIDSYNSTPLAFLLAGDYHYVIVFLYLHFPNPSIDEVAIHSLLFRVLQAPVI